jgi:hypothetical protein
VERRRSGSSHVLVFVLAVLAAAGCDPDQFWAETKVASDGRVTRAIYQLAKNTPSEALDAKQWRAVTWAKRMARMAWGDRIDALPIVAKDKELDYFAAWGEFESVRRLPRTYVRESARGLPQGELVLDYDRNDLGLVVEHEWQETLTEIVSVHGVHAAREEIVDRVIPFMEELLARLLGDEYDTSALAEWGRETGRAWFYDYTDLLFANHAFADMNEEEETRALAPVWARHGFVITDDSGRSIESAEYNARFTAFAAKLMREKIRRRDGRPVDQAKLDELALWAFGKGWWGSYDSDADDNESFADYNKVAEVLAREVFGSEDKFVELFMTYRVRLMGIYGSDWGARPEFDYSLELPGRIVETNGVVVSESETRWSFSGWQAYPSGYTMRGRSLEPRSDRQVALLGRAVLADARSVVRYVDLMRADGKLSAAVQECIEKNSLEPFRSARAEPDLSAYARQQFDAMAKLLGLPE